jgi:hypothetical protein
MFKLLTLYNEVYLSEHYGYHIPDKTINDNIDLLNNRFKRAGVGYQFQGNQIIRIDNEILHQEIIKPVLAFISNPDFKTVNEEYLKAHEHYRHGRNKECLNECLKSFESVMKVICNKKGWHYNISDTSKNLISILLQNELLPSYFQTSITSLRSMLESGIPTIRNRNSGHGQGPNKIVVDDSLASYCLNLTGSTIKFLIELAS